MKAALYVLLGKSNLFVLHLYEKSNIFIKVENKLGETYVL